MCFSQSVPDYSLLPGVVKPTTRRSPSLGLLALCHSPVTLPVTCLPTNLLRIYSNTRLPVCHLPVHASQFGSSASFSVPVWLHHPAPSHQGFLTFPIAVLPVLLGTKRSSVRSSSSSSSSCSLLVAASCVKCEQLTQPASVTVQPSQRLTISCQVSYSLTSSWTYWIRQHAGNGLEWICNDETIKYSLNDTFSVDLDSSSKTVTLNGQNTQPEDSAVYYCARQEHSDTNIRTADQNPLGV
nr:uncharacterized protein LOC129166966 [Nothobranchius furzeri]